MYRHNVRRPNHRQLARRLAIAACIAVIVVIAFLHSLRSNTELKQSAAVNKTIAAGPQPKRWDEPVFSLELPPDWKFLGVQHDIYTIYHWQAGTKHADDRFLDVFVDSNPAKVALNRMLPVQVNGDHIDASATDVSDNCASFTQKPATPTAQQGQHAKWQGVDFLCDLGNTQRNVVGTGSPEGLNRFTMSGPSGSHHFFIMYTDHNYQPDYNIMVNALLSFRVK